MLMLDGNELLWDEHYRINSSQFFPPIQFGLTPNRTGLVLLSISIPYVAFAPTGGLMADKIVSFKGKISETVYTVTGFYSE